MQPIHIYRRPIHWNLMHMNTTELLKGTLQTIVLKVLEDNNRMYGYEITQKVKELSSEKLIITEGSLYPTLHKLESGGLLTTEIEFIGKRKRKYYSLTKEGSTMLETKLTDLYEFIRTLSSVLQIKPSF